jgi:hypothetical protein
MWREFPDFGVRMGTYAYAAELVVPDQARREHTRLFTSASSPASPPSTPRLSTPRIASTTR